MTDTDTVITTNSASSSASTANSNTVTDVTTTKSEDDNTNSLKSIQKTSSNTKSSSKLDSTQIAINSITATSTDTIVLKATVASGSVYVPNGLVAFKINGKTIGQANVTNGKASLRYTIPGYSAGTYTTTAVFGATSRYSSSTANGTLKITKTSSTTTVKDLTGIEGSSVRILAVVKDSKGAYAHGGNVVFKLNGLSIGTSKVVNGGAAINYTIPTSFTKSSYAITATYSGTGALASSKASSTLTVLTPQKTTTSVSDITSSAGKTITVKATVKSGSTAISGGTVVFKLNGLTIGKATVKSGSASISYAIPKSLSKSSYDITATYGGYVQYLTSTTSAKLKLETQTAGGKNTSLTQNSALKPYITTSASNCQVYNSVIQNLAKTITSGKTTTLAQAKAIFSYLNDKTSYDYYANTRYGALGTWNRKAGNCCDMANLMVAVCRAAGIPARYAHATCYFRSGLVTGHVWAQVYVNGAWHNCDLTSNYNSFGNIVNWNRCGSIRYYTTLPF
ncbi:MAG: Ig-like domain repeat protein [Methanosphaera sp.]|nr:Ig-like domain repeat protein [Methanosphaera sp.]